MYKNILVAIDGSEMAELAQKHAIALAKVFGSKTVLVHVTPPWSSLVVGDAVVMYPPSDYDESMKKSANELLSKAQKGFKSSGIECETIHTTETQAHRAIVQTAKDKGSDLIVMGSHGRHGLMGLMLGSVATKTVTHAHIPVLICRT